MTEDVTVAAFLTAAHTGPALACVRFIKSAQRLGFSLDEDADWLKPCMADMDASAHKRTVWTIGQRISKGYGRRNGSGTSAGIGHT